MLAITIFWIVAFSVMIYFMIKEWNSLSRATRAKVRTTHKPLRPRRAITPLEIRVNKTHT